MSRSNLFPIGAILAALIVALATFGLAAQEDPVEPPTSSGGEVGITVALSPADASTAEVISGGESLPFRVLEPEPWQVAIYFDQLLSDPLTARNATVFLAERAGALADLGPVQILLGGETVRSSLPPSRDSDTISEAFSWLRIRETSADAQAQVRVEFAEAAASGMGDTELGVLLEEALRREADLIRLQREGLLLWATEHRGADRRLLLLVGSGYDSDPVPFYEALLRGSGRPHEVEAAPVRPTASEVGQALALSGWTVLAYSPSERGDALLQGAAPEVKPEVVVTPDGREVERGTFNFNLLGRGEDEDDESQEAELNVRLDPAGAFEPLARATAGAVVKDNVVLDAWLEEVAWRAVLAVQTPAVHSPLAIEVRTAAGGQAVAAPSWAGRGAPAALSAARARSLAMSGESTGGDLQIAALVADGEPAQLAVEFSSAAEGRLTAPLRVTVAEVGEDGATILEQREVGPDIVSRGLARLSLAGGQPGERPVVVVVDELSTRRWGATFAGFTTQAGDVVDVSDGSAVLDLPQASVIRLLAPQEPLLVGRVRFAAVVSDPAVERVDFLLDGAQEAVRRAPPFEADLDLGPLPRTRRVEAVARNARGEHLGSDVLLVNSGNSDFSIRLFAPGAESGAGGSVVASGSVTVEAEVALSRNVKVSSVEFFWVDTLVGTLYSGPFRQRVVLPEDNSRGFVRAVVTLADGAVAEEVLFVNTAGSSERLQVTLVEVLAVVTDPAGNPVPDLDRSVFTLKEEGDVQEIAAFSSAEALPLTVGLAVDSSASMFMKLPRVQLAAMGFLRDLMQERDRGFVIGFGREPQLMSPTTGDVDRLVDGVEAMRPDGFTSIWKGIVYSLVQLQGAPGKKALIVYSDGADEDPDFSYRAARRFARVVGVPIYVILSNNEIVRTQGRGLNIRGFLGRLRDLVDDVGGKVYFTRVGDNLEDVYAEIGEELRSQYVLGYYGEQDESAGWRKITVDVSQPGLRVRTARGRYP